MLRNGLKLFIADIIDEDTNGQTFWYIVGKTYDSALKSFIKEANKTWYRYCYYFYEAGDNVIEEFVEYHGEKNIVADIYDR